MNDREMLEFAAKAAGIERGADRFDGGISITDITGRHRSLPKWNPRDDDGDAFRLMVRLGLEPRFIDNSHLNGIEPSRVTLHNISGIAEKVGDDPLAATRLAIFRAAVEIGRAMG